MLCPYTSTGTSTRLGGQLSKVPNESLAAGFKGYEAPAARQMGAVWAAEF